MVIITADDYGKPRHDTDSILKCFSSERITSSIAMVFMEDSERTASLACMLSDENVFFKKAPGLGSLGIKQK